MKLNAFSESANFDLRIWVESSSIPKCKLMQIKKNVPKKVSDFNPEKVFADKIEKFISFALRPE